MSDNKEYFRQSESKSQSQSIDNPWKFIIPGIIIAFFGYQIMQSKQAPTPTQPESRTPTQPESRTPTQPDSRTPTQPDSRTPTQPDQQNTSQEFSLVGTWQGVGSNQNSRYVAKYNFQPNGTYQLEMTIASKNPQLSSGILMTYGSYKRTGQNSIVVSSEKSCAEGMCTAYISSQRLTIVNSTELSDDAGQKIRKLSD
jgi:hypothetical protein